MVMRSYVILFLSTLVIIGCSRPPSEEIQPPLPLAMIQETVNWARENFDAVERLHVQELYAQDFQKARDELVRAENFLQENLYEEAYTSALESLAASQRILRQFYQDTIAQSAQEAKTEIQKITDEDPDNPLREFLPELKSILDYSDEVATSSREIDCTKVLADLEKVTQIGRNTRTMVKQTLESDVSFDSGRYDLSEEGKHILEMFAKAIIANAREYPALYPDQTLIIKIKVVGYSDQVDFQEGTKLLKKLAEGIERGVPQRQPERRKFLNQRLSEFRARTISEYITQFIIQEDSAAHIEQENVGLGEVLPPGISPPYPIEDSRRRICKIYGYIIVQ
jgi:outer membrane protein OmpA-like peptidoglycan-associated protein